MALRLANGYWASKPRTLALLHDVRDSGWCRRTVYIPPAGDGPHTHRDTPHPPQASWPDDIAFVTEQSGPSETGLGVFLGEDRAVAVLPPFPLLEYTGRPGTHVAPLVELLASEIVTGVVLLRLGRYAVGVLRGDELVASKTGTRHVKSRHRAGGSSQRRFERSRERLIRELFDKTCEVARAVLSPYEAEIDYVLIGGERHTLGRFVKRCRYMRDLGPRTLGRTLQINRPGQRALDGVASEVWKSRVLVFERSD